MNIEEQVELLMQGTDYGDEDLKKAMTAELRTRLLEAQKEGRALRVYCGYDPRTSDLHLGHTITMRKLRQFQDLGHEVTFLIGTGTSMVGDPSDKDKLRAVLSKEETEHNARTYAEQAFSILDREKTKIRFNDEWLLDLKLADLIKLGSAFTIQQFISRENFKLRWEKGDPVYLHETFYALMQGYDAVAMNTDVQVGGSDQLFNIITAGRKLQELYGERPQIGILVSILPGTDGVVRMSKSLGNHIPIHATPEDMYGKVMSIPDNVMPIYFKLATRYTPAQIREVEAALKNNSRHPRDVKMELAREIVEIFHGKSAAEEAEGQFKRVFQERGLPENIKAIPVSNNTSIVTFIFEFTDVVNSNSEARRLILQKGVKIDGRVVDDPNEILNTNSNSVIQIGKRNFFRIQSKDDNKDK